MPQKTSALLHAAYAAAEVAQKAMSCLEECAPLQECPRHRTVLSRVSGVEGIVSLQPHMAFGHLFEHNCY